MGGSLFAAVNIISLSAYGFIRFYAKKHHSHAVPGCQISMDQFVCSKVLHSTCNLIAHFHHNRIFQSLKLYSNRDYRIPSTICMLTSTQLSHFIARNVCNQHLQQNLVSGGMDKGKAFNGFHCEISGYMQLTL